MAERQAQRDTLLSFHRGNRFKCVGLDEPVLRMPHRQYGTWCDADDSFGHISHQKVCHHSAAVRAHHDQVDIFGLGVIGYFECR